MFTLGERVLLPVNVPKNEHWLLVVLFKVHKRITIHVKDSKYWEYAPMQLHERLVKQLVKVTQLMGGVVGQPITCVTASSPVPLQQKKMFNFCAFHVLAWIYMEATGQTMSKMSHPDVDIVREYVQYMMLSHDILKLGLYAKQEDSDENEFVL